MFKVKSIALAAALAGNAGYAAAAGCYPAYVAGGSYASGDWVSATTTKTEIERESCTVGTTGCSSSGYKTVTTTTTETYNYQCVDNPNSAFCSNGSYAPNGNNGSIAWIKQGAKCSGTATAPAPVPAEWSGGGCPKPYVAGTDYGAGAVVSVAKSGYSMVYQCLEEPNNQFCGLSSYAPGTDLYWENAWTSLGSCDGSISPTKAPVFTALDDAGGCPGEFKEGGEYEEGDKVSKDGLVYECKAWPSGQHCSQIGYEPGMSVGEGSNAVEYWKEAWAITGYCSGTLTPTAAPSFVTLGDLGGCPEEWSPKMPPEGYEEGDRVSSMGMVYSCKAWPMSAHCGQAGYEPNVDPASPGAWKDAWAVAGYCSGTGVPTASPNFDVANVAVCPGEWVAGTNTAYEEGDMVSVSVSTTPIRKVAYKCKAWPYSGYCGQFSPTEYGGNQGWALVGSCNGSIGPTMSPVFVSMSEYGDGCPQEWSASSTSYEADDFVSLTVSGTPERKIVYKCRDWPNTGYCNQGEGFKPGSQNSNMAWTMVGMCEGSMAPTGSPTAYTGDCLYDRCRMVDSTENCTPGSTGCSCNASASPSSSCVRDIEEKSCEDTQANLWSSTADYEAGDVVRLVTKRFKCRNYPNSLWCEMEAYRPTLENTGIWTQAWTTDGMCT